MPCESAFIVQSKCNVFSYVCSHKFLMLNMGGTCLTWFFKACLYLAHSGSVIVTQLNTIDFCHIFASR